MKKKALVLDDSKINRLTISTFLRLIGFNIKEVDDGIEGFRAFNDCIYDVIFTDLEMPNMNGFEFIKRIRGNEKLKHIPVIIISSYTNIDSSHKINELGSIYYIDKPFSKEKIKAVLDLAKINEVFS